MGSTHSKPASAHPRDSKSSTPECDETKGNDLKKTTAFVHHHYWNTSNQRPNSGGISRKASKAAKRKQNVRQKAIAKGVENLIKSRLLEDEAKARHFLYEMEEIDREQKQKFELLAANDELIKKMKEHEKLGDEILKEHEALIKEAFSEIAKGKDFLVPESSDELTKKMNEQSELENEILNRCANLAKRLNDSGNRAKETWCIDAKYGLVKKMEDHQQKLEDTQAAHIQMIRKAMEEERRKTFKE